jgi:hypothetical protein
MFSFNSVSAHICYMNGRSRLRKFQLAFVSFMYLFVSMQFSLTCPSFEVAICNVSFIVEVPFISGK